jgi:hypothetical protein
MSCPAQHLGSHPAAEVLARSLVHHAYSGREVFGDIRPAELETAYYRQTRFRE